MALDSDCDYIACGKDLPQAAWLRADLAAHAGGCTLLYWHHPRWSSGLAGSNPAGAAFWEIAVEMGVTLVVNGDDHDYERFAPQDAAANPA